MDVSEHKKFVYVGRTHCGCALGVVTDDGDERTANAVAGFIVGGLTVERVAWSAYRQIAKEPTFMNCPHGQLTLPEVKTDQAFVADLEEGQQFEVNLSSLAQGLPPEKDRIIIGKKCGMKGVSLAWFPELQATVMVPVVVHPIEPSENEKSEVRE